MPRPISSRLAAACAPVLALFLCLPALAAAKGVPVHLRVVDTGGKILAEKSLRTGTTSIKTSPRADCFGEGTGGSGKPVKIKGATALGLLGQAAKSTRSLRPLLVSDYFDFGLALCGVGGKVAKSNGSWYLKVNHRNPNKGGELVKLHRGDDVLWYLSDTYPYPDELALTAPHRTAKGKSFSVRVFSYDDKGKKRPAAGVKVTGAAKRTGADGRTTVVLRRPTRLIARAKGEIPSNRAPVCVARRCPRHGRG